LPVVVTAEELRSLRLFESRPTSELAQIVADVFVMSSYTTSGTGVTHVNVNQRYEGLEVFGAHATINVGPDGRVIFTGGRLVPLNPVTSTVPKLDTTKAVEMTAAELDLDRPAKLRVLRAPVKRAEKTVLSTGGISGAPIESRLGWWPENGRLRLAYQNVIDDVESSSLWAATVDAKTGRLLNADDWTSHDDIDDLRQRLPRAASRAVQKAQTALPQRSQAFQPLALASSPDPVIDARRTASSRGRPRARTTPSARWSATPPIRWRRRTAGMTSTKRQAPTTQRRAATTSTPTWIRTPTTHPI
jgi:hypothetical protein